MAERLVIQFKSNTQEVENKLLSQNLESALQRIDVLEKVNEGYRGLVVDLKTNHEETSHKTKKLAGTIVGINNKQF